MTFHLAAPQSAPTGRWLVTLFLVCIATACWAVPCHAAEPTDWPEYNKWRIRSFKVDGAPSAVRKDLQHGLALTGQWKLLRGQKRPAFSAKLLAEDLNRIRLYLAVRGYPAAQVVPTATFDPQSRNLDLVITISPGNPVRIGKVRYTGWPSGVAMPDTSVPGMLSVGQVFSDAALGTGLRAAQTYLRNAGYVQVQVHHKLLPLGPSQVSLVMEFEAGEFHVIDEVVVEGCSADLEGLALRLVNIPPGTRYSESRLTAAALDLRLTQLFRQVVLSTEQIEPGKLRLTVQLENGRMRTWDAAVGTWSDNPWMVKSTWTHRNILEQGRGFTARGAFATHELNAGVGVFWLGWLSPRARTRVGLDAIGEDEEAYESREYRAEIVQSFRPRNREFLNVGTALSQNRIVEKIAGSSDTPEPQGRLWEVWVDRKWDRTNDPIFPVRGGFLKLSLTFAEPWIFSEVPYASGQIDAAKYLDLPGGGIFTARTRMGVAKPLKSETEVLATRRFYAGGYNSHRGYARHGLGPRDSEDNARGGEVVLLASGEVRFPLFWIVEAGLFMDTGNVWGDVGALSLANYPVSLGVTLGLRSPLGPLRIGYANNVADLVPGQARQLWHFGIGYPW